MADNSVLINEAGELKREQELHLGRLEMCNDTKEIKKEFINYLGNELKIREKYTKHRIELIEEWEL